VVEILGSFKDRIISSANKNNLTAPFPILILFIYFFCFVVPVLYLIMVGRVDMLVSLPTLEEMILVFHIYYNVGYRFVIYSLYYVEVLSVYS
jgi:hypothetical protein